MIELTQGEAASLLDYLELNVQEVDIACAPTIIPADPAEEGEG